MPDYIPINDKEKKEMLAEIGVSSVSELFTDVPRKLRGKLNLPKGKSQQEVYEYMLSLAKMNKVYEACFLGAGCYRHFIPSVVKSLAGREEFLTSYTPYQAEISQGVLQAIFEYQSMICALTGMDAANASHYSGAAAAAEACLMASGKKAKIVTFDNINSDTLETLKTYLAPRNISLCVLEAKDGKAYAADFSDTDGVYIETPNYFGLIEDGKVIAEAAHAAGAKLIVGANPISLAVLIPPGEYGADIAVGEAQPLGLPPSFGGPNLGYMAVKSKDMRKLPGRIAGETVDRNGERAYVLTLQAREQHIRREKASSNICSNEAWCALTASIYLASLGKGGLKEVASACVSNAHYLASVLENVGAQRKYGGEFFHEFVTVTNGKAKQIAAALDKAGILGGLPLNDDETLWCATELNKRADMDKVAEICGGLR